MISVIVPVYKVEKYLSRCVESILEQSYRDFELILVDDGSPDNCGKICDEYAARHSRIKAIHKENRGLSSARNAGMGTASGEFYCFVDSDDWVDPDYLQVLYSLITTYKADLSACFFCKAVEGAPNPKNVKSEKVQVFDRGLFYNAIIDGTYAGYAWNKLYKASIITEHHLVFDETILNGEDLPFTVEYLRYCNNVVFTSAQLYYYNIRPNSITTSCGFSVRGYTILYARERVLHTLRQAAPECVDIEMAAYISHLIKQKYLLEPIREAYPAMYQEVTAKLASHKRRIMALQGVSFSTRMKLFLMVNFDRIFGRIFRARI